MDDGQPKADSGMEKQPEMIVSPSAKPRLSETLSKKPVVLLIVTLFAAIGCYLIFRSFAAGPVMTYTWDTNAAWNTGVATDVQTANNVVTLASTTPVTLPGTNLALHHPAHASSTNLSNTKVNLLARYVNDNNLSTRWGSKYSDPQWIYIDLGKTYAIGEVKLNWERAYGKAYKIQTSNDAKSWTTIYSTSTGDGNTDDLTNLNGQGRYVRMYGTKRGTQWGYSLYEMAIYGKTASASTLRSIPTYVPSGSLTLTYAASADVQWSGIALLADIPSGTSMTYQLRTSEDKTTWSAWATDITKVARSKYIQIQTSLATSDATKTPVLHSIALTYIPPTITPPSMPTVRLGASPASITSGSSSTLTWSSTNADSCMASGAWSGAKATSGNESTGVLTATSAYILNCTGTGGMATANTTVTVTTPSGTSVLPKPPAQYTKLVFDDAFAGTKLDTTKWNTFMGDNGGRWGDNGQLPSPYSEVGNSNEFNAEYGNPNQITVNNGLTLNTQRDNTFSKLGYSWASGYATTAGKFSFDHGYFQVGAQIPDSTTGGWFTIWFLGGSNEMDLDESGFLGCGNSVVNQCIASNMNNGDSQKFYNAGIDLSKGYHAYGIDYQPGKSVTIYLDGKPVTNFTKNVPTGKYFIILTNTMATSKASGWHTTVSSSAPSPIPFKVSEAQVWQ